LIGLEACASAHHWACELAKLGQLVTSKLLPDYNPLARIDAVKLEYVFGDIQTDRGNLHLDGSPHMIRHNDHPFGITCR
jgi:hypothetical protein